MKFLFELSLTFEDYVESTCTVLENLIFDGATYTQKGNANAAYDLITSLEFVFILHLIIDIMEVTYYLCQTLQRKSQDIKHSFKD